MGQGRRRPGGTDGILKAFLHTLEESVLRDGFGGVMRAGRIEPAPRAKQRGYQ